MLNVRRKRRKGHKRKNPSVAIIDSQSAKSGLPQSQKGIDGNKRVKGIKADNGYRGKLTETIKEVLSIDMHCVKSNYGTTEFIPLESRWVVERTIAWLDNFRRLCRNYEQLLSTAASMVKMAFLMILIKHI